MDGAGQSLQRRGILAVFLGINVPGARAGVILAAALAGLSYPPVALAMIAGNTVFYGWHVLLGYLVGPTAVDLLERIDIPIGPIILGLILLGLVAWLVMRPRHKATVAPEGAVVDRLRSWAEGACLGCLAASAIQRNIERSESV